MLYSWMKIVSEWLISIVKCLVWTPALGVTDVHSFARPSSGSTWMINHLLLVFIRHMLFLFRMNKYLLAVHVKSSWWKMLSWNYFSFPACPFSSYFLVSPSSLIFPSICSHSLNFISSGITLVPTLSLPSHISDKCVIIPNHSQLNGIFPAEPG